LVATQLLDKDIQVDQAVTATVGILVLDSPTDYNTQVVAVVAQEQPAAVLKTAMLDALAATE
jgi:hypothetical protein